MCSNGLFVSDPESEEILHGLKPQHERNTERIFAFHKQEPGHNVGED